MSSIDDEIKKAEAAAKSANAKAKRLKKEKRQRTILGLGRSLLQETKATSVADFYDRFSVTPKGPTPLPPELQQQLTELADKMEWNGHFWKMENLPEVGKFLAQFRTKKSDRK